MPRSQLFIALAVLALVSCAEDPTADPTARQFASRAAITGGLAPEARGQALRAVLIDDAASSDVSKYLNALEVVDRYNTVLLGLVEGRSDRVVSMALEAFTGSLSSFTVAAGPSYPGLSALSGEVRSLAQLAETVAGRVELEQVADAAAPVVQGVVEAVFVKDADATSGIDAVSAERRSRLLRRAAGETARTASLIGARYRDPPADSALRVSRETARDRLRVALGQVGSQTKTFGLAGQAHRYLFDLSGSASGNAVLTDDAQDRIDRLVASVDALGARFREVMDSLAPSRTHLAAKTR